MKKLMAALAIAVMVAFAAPAFAATNPFTDVPQGHWAYDAVELLASRGIVSAYPDGAFRGPQPVTRYEMASIVARALVTVDAEKASAQDMELLKRLVMEFKDELDALGVKVDELDKRVAAVEDQLGGWKLSGRFYFDANFAGGDQAEGSSYTEGSDNSFEKAQFRLYLEKQIDENTSFYAQVRAGAGSAGPDTSGLGDITQINVRDIWVQTMLPWDVNFRVGRFLLDFEDDHGLYVDNEPVFGDFRVDGFEFSKTWNSFTAKAIVGRNTSYDLEESGYMFYALDLTWQPSEAFFFGVNGVWAVDDADVEYLYDGAAVDFTTYSVYAGYSFSPAISLSGVYYMQDLDSGIVTNGVSFMGAMGAPATRVDTETVTEDSPTAWKVALDFGQDLLKFTGLRIEYMQQDNTFVAWRDPYQFGGVQDASNAATVAQNMPWNDATTTFIFAYAEQKWNDKWSSYLRYTSADFDTDGLDDAVSYGIGVTYQYTPAIAFRLAYDLVDYGSNNPTGFYSDKDHVLQFRTSINF